MKLGYFLLGLYGLVFLICGISPYDRSVWVAENLPIVLLVIGVVLIARRFDFSRASYLFMIVLPILHTIGGHYTFERVPFGFVTELFGFERNHYDRIAHFSVGFYAYPIAEFVLRKGFVSNRIMACLFAVFAIFTVASLYEVFEWWYALAADPSAGLAVLGSQGDVWDAQKDMLADGLGACCSAGIFLLTFRHSMVEKENEL